MSRGLGERGRRLALVAALAAAMCAGAPARGADTLSFGDAAGDANTVGWHCAVECGGAPAPVSEPSIDVLAVDIADVGSSFVFTTGVTALEHVSPASTPDDIAGYDIGMHIDGTGLAIVAQRTASHGRPRAFVIANGPNGSSSRHPASVSFDHAGDTVRVTVATTALNGALADACPTCRRINSLNDLGQPYIISYVLSGATSPAAKAAASHGLGSYSDYDGAGPLYSDRAFADSRPMALPGVSAGGRYLGTGPTTGTVAWSSPAGVIGYEQFPCPTLAASVELTATVSLTNGTTHYSGPIELRGNGESNHCNTTTSGTFLLRSGTVSGTDVNGLALHCPSVGGLAVGMGRWTLTAGASCSLDGMPLELSLHIEGAYAPTGASAAGVDSGHVAGSMFLSSSG